MKQLLGFLLLLPIIKTVFDFLIFKPLVSWLAPNAGKFLEINSAVYMSKLGVIPVFLISILSTGVVVILLTKKDKLFSKGFLIISLIAGIWLTLWSLWSMVWLGWI